MPHKPCALWRGNDGDGGCFGNAGGTSRISGSEEGETLHEGGATLGQNLGVRMRGRNIISRRKVNRHFRVANPSFRRGRKLKGRAKIKNPSFRRLRNLKGHAKIKNPSFKRRQKLKGRASFRNPSSRRRRKVNRPFITNDEESPSTTGLRLRKAKGRQNVVRRGLEGWRRRPQRGWNQCLKRDGAFITKLIPPLFMKLFQNFNGMMSPLSTTRDAREKKAYVAWLTWLIFRVSCAT
ncbi:hypothetical protein Salat_1816500 [Sesamum alatum]|uniref:Uncharacterized protein n=1 Tax=Sesamum alatum TaxID=300844 RepID=A0AAE2CHJ7_9LAMI|nr:hypothetical protein Salat_1816500 [Sesamum alatum]